MISTIIPNTLGSAKPNDKFKFENDKDIYYFISLEHWAFILWNDTKKQRVTLQTKFYYINKKIIKI